MVYVDRMWAYMVDYFAERYSKLAREKLGIDVLDTQLQYSIRLYCYGAVGMTCEWLMKDNITSAQTVVQMMFNAMPENMRKLFFLPQQNESPRRTGPAEE